MQLKAMVDCQIMVIHPHMAKIIAYYDLLIYRYYSPVWNRNGEGKLQTLKEEEEKEEEEEEEKKKKKEKIMIRRRKKRMMMMMMMMMMIIIIIIIMMTKKN